AYGGADARRRLDRPKKWPRRWPLPRSEGRPAVSKLMRGSMKTLLQDLSLSAVVAGFIATVISYAGPLVIIFQVAQAADMPQAALTSWVWAISIGSGVLGI